MTVSKLTPTVSAWPTASGITYGQTLASSTLSGGSASVGGSFVFSNPSIVPSAGTSSQSVTFQPTNSNVYSSVTGSVSVTVAKATPTVSAWPSASSITYGQTLASSTLSGGSASVSGSFVFSSPGTAPSAGTSSQSVTFKPSDSNDYNSVTGSVSVTVAKATPTISAWPTASSITYGQTLASSTLSGGAASTSGSFAFANPSTAPDSGSPSEAVVFTPSDTSDYDSVSGSVSVTVAKATLTVKPTMQAVHTGRLILHLAQPTAVS